MLRNLAALRMPKVPKLSLKARPVVAAAGCKVLLQDGRHVLTLLAWGAIGQPGACAAVNRGKQTRPRVCATAAAESANNDSAKVLVLLALAPKLKPGPATLPPLNLWRSDVVGRYYQCPCNASRMFIVPTRTLGYLRLQNMAHWMIQATTCDCQAVAA